MNKGYHRNYPPFQILSQEKITAIHRAVLDVLENTGIKFESKKALDLFESHGCTVDHKSMVVKIPPGMAEDSLRMAPSSFRLKSRDPKDDVVIGGDTVYFEGSVGQDFVDFDTLERRPATVKENDEGVIVLDALENVHTLLSYCPYMNIEGVPPALQLTWSAAARFRNSTKISRTAHSMGSEQFSIKMAYATNQDVVVSMEPSPPLAWSEDAIESGLRACDTPFPVRFGNGDIIGATSPATIAGSLVTAIAETVSGMVMINLKKPGKKMAANNFVFPIEMVYGQPDFNSIMSSLHTTAFNQYFRHWEVPVWAGHPQFSLAKNIGYQVGMEKALSVITSAISGANVVDVVGGLHAELTWSPVVAVLDNDLAGAVGRFIEGFDVDEEMLAVDIIDNVISTEATFLGEEHTRKWWKKEFFIPRVMDRLPYDLWHQQGRKNEIDNAREKVDEIIKTHKPSVPLTKDQDKAIDEILDEARKYYEAKGMI
jgi:trimethylamine--corrinoid protein Co-methyltransferase